MVKKIIIILFHILVATLASLQARDTLTLEDAIRIGLQNNYDIRIAHNEAEIGSINKSLGNAGFLPRVEVSGIHHKLIEDGRVFTDGINQGVTDTRVTSTTGIVSLDWTIFDGLRMFTTYNRLSALEKLGNLEARIQIENTITDILAAYYDIVREEKSMRVLINSVETSEERYQIAQTKRELGSGSQYELLLAQTDLNADRAAVIRQEVTLNNARLALIRLLDLDIGSNFSTVKEINLNEPITLEDLYAEVMQNNHNLEAAAVRVQVMRLERREISRERYPEIDFNLGYAFDRIDTDTDLFVREHIGGLGIGLTARVSLFDGFNTRRRMQVAHVRYKNNKLELDHYRKRLEALLDAEYKNYINSKRLIELENENLELAERTLSIALERFSLATITSIELRESQRILLDTENRLITAQYEAKLSETELLRISGELGEQFDF